jgi:hypothetical protein
VSGDLRVYRQAHSISHRVWQLIEGRSFAARVLATFDRACTLVTPEGRVATLVLPQIAEGPLNIVINGEPGDFGAVGVGSPAQSTPASLLIGEMAVSLDGVRVWEPRPDWQGLRHNQDTIARQLGFLKTRILSRDPGGSLLALLKTTPLASSGPPPSGSGMVEETLEPVPQELAPATLASARTGADALRAGWQGEKASLQEGVAQLAGLGAGLTPAGDDFLAGFMLWAWLAHPEPRRLCDEIIKVAEPRSGTIPAALLRAAGNGECSIAWHRLLEAASNHEQDQMAHAIKGILSHGHTSGADTLAGFLWMAQPPLASRQ